MIIYLTENNTSCYGVTFQNDGCVKVQKFEDISDLENIILYKMPLKTFLGKNEVCYKTLMSEALDKSVFDGSTTLLKKSDENCKNRYVYIGGNMICSFLTNDNIYKYFSNMGINLTPFSIAIGEENINFLIPYFKFIKREKFFDNELLKTKENSVCPFDYHVSNCGNHSVNKLRKHKIHSNYDE